MKDFAIFILTHGRPDNQKTASALYKSGYTGKIYYVVDDEDRTLPQYEIIYGEDVIVFNKENYVQKTDTAEIHPNRNFAVFARNAIEDIAREMGYEYFGMFDDDILKFRYRWEEENKLRSLNVHNMDKVIEYTLDFMEDCNIATMSFGINTNFMPKIELQDFTDSKYRMCFNSYIRNAKFKVDWKLNMWEDVITSVLSNKYGQLWLQSPSIQMDMTAIGKENIGGNSEAYRNVKLLHQLFYTQIACPDCFYIRLSPDKMVPWSNYKAMCNKLISSKYKR